MKRKELDSIYVGMSNAFFGAVDPRRRQEKKDSRMIREDRNAVANLPRQAQHHEFNQDTFVEHLANDQFEIDMD